MDLWVGNAVGRKKQKRFGDRAVCAFRAERAARDLAICGRTGDAGEPNRDIDRESSWGGNSLVKTGPFDNE